MQTPSLRRRVIVLGVTVVVVVMVAVDVLLYVGFRTRLHDNLDQILDERAELVRTTAATRDPAALATQLRALGIRATITAPDGTVHRSEPPSPFLGRNLPPTDPGGPTVSRQVDLPDGGTAVVFARRSGVDDALRKLLVLEAVGLVAATVFATLLLLGAARVALRPLQLVASSARRTAAGERGQRLRPDRADTLLGQMATAYDDMLDALEKAIAEAKEAQATSEKLRQRARKIIETSGAAFVAMDRTGAIVDWNRQAEQAFGWPASEVLGRSLPRRSSLPPSDPPTSRGWSGIGRPARRRSSAGRSSSPRSTATATSSPPNSSSGPPATRVRPSSTPSCRTSPNGGWGRRRSPAWQPSLKPPKRRSTREASTGRS